VAAAFKAMTMDAQHADPARDAGHFSVVVVTYNSTDTVVETLDSIAAQDHGPLELIVCDDASRDATCAVVQQWLQVNAGRFVRASLLPSAANQGLCRNLARGYSAATGTWLKAIAGDDLLLPGAIAAYAQAAENSPHAAIVARVQSFRDEGGQRIWGEVLPADADMEALALPAAALLRRLAVSNPIPAPGVCLRRSTFERLGGFDPEFTHLDDWPLWMKLTLAGLSFGTLPLTLVGYRVSGGSISANRSALAVNRQYLADLVHFYRRYQRHALPLLLSIDRGIETLRWSWAAGPMRQRPVLYRATRALFGLSPHRWAALLLRR